VHSRKTKLKNVFFCFLFLYLGGAGTAPKVLSRHLNKKGPFRLLYNQGCPAVARNFLTDSGEGRARPHNPTQTGWGSLNQFELLA
jgi:hypothetical protein